MPHLIAVAATSAASAVATEGTLLYSTAYFVTETALTLAATAALSAATAAKPTSAEVAMTALNQTRPVVRHGYGRMRLSGPAALYDTVPGYAVESRLLHEGRVGGFEQPYMDDTKVTIDGNHFVQSGGDPYATNLIQVFLSVGHPIETATAELVAICGDKWSVNDRNDGIARFDMICKAIKDADVSKRYPKGEPQFSVVTRMSLVYDWRDPAQHLNDPSTWLWSENAPLCHAHWEWYGRHLEKASDDGVAPNATQLAAWAEAIEPALDFWTAAVNIGSEERLKKDGSTEPFYRVALMTLSTDKPDAVRQTFLRAYDGWMARRSDGAWNVRAGRYVAPTFDVTDDMLKGLTWEVGTDDSALVNILSGGFLSPDNDFTTQPIDNWIDEEAVSAEGEVPDSFDLPQVPSHAQARYLLSREMKRRRAGRAGTLKLDMSGLRIADEAHRWVRVVRSTGPMSMRNVVLEIAGEGRADYSDLSVSYPVRISGPYIDEWTPALDEGFGPNATDRTIPDVLPPPEILDAYPVFQSDRAALLVIKIANPHDDSRTYQLTYHDSTGAAVDGPWQEADVVTGGLELRAGPVGIGAYYVTVRANIAGRPTERATPPVEIDVDTAHAPYIPPTYQDGTDINQLKPAAPGADVTGNNTAKDTTHVGNVPTATVLQNIVDAKQAGDDAKQAADAAADRINAVAAMAGGAANYDATVGYVEGNIVKSGGHLYRYKLPGPGTGHAPPDTAYWDDIGQFADVGDALRAYAVHLQDVDTSVGANASDILALNSKVQTRNNLLPNSTFTRGFGGWAYALYSGIGPGAFNLFNGVWGPIAAWSGPAITGIFGMLSDPVAAQAGVEYTLTADFSIIATAGNGAYVDIEFLDAAHKHLSYSTNHPVAPTNDFDENDRRRNVTAITGTAPANTVYMRVRIVFDATGITGVGARRVKLERGSTPATAWSDEATDGKIAAEVDASASAIAGLTTKVGNRDGVATTIAEDILQLHAATTDPASGLAATAEAVHHLSAEVIGDRSGKTTTVAEDLTNISGEVGEHTGTITELSRVQGLQTTAISDLKATWSVLVDVDGEVSGIINNNTGETSDITLIGGKIVLQTDGGVTTFDKNGLSMVKDASNYITIGWKTA